MSTPLTQNDLQRTFIAMLFAFAVSVVAQQIAELLIVVTDNWHSDVIPASPLSGRGWDFVALASHQMLALFMLTISWIMWSRSRAPGHLEDIEQIVSAKYVIFIFEIMLVTLYLSISKSVEGDFAAYLRDKSVASYITQTSSRPEAMQMVWVFSLFVLWDYIADVVRSPLAPPAKTWLSKGWGHISGVLIYCSLSLICALGAYLVYKVSPINGTPRQAIYGDLALMCLLLLFNHAKFIEVYFSGFLEKKHARNNTKRVPTRKSSVVSVVVLLFFFLFVLLIEFSKCTQG